MTQSPYFKSNHHRGHMVSFCITRAAMLLALSHAGFALAQTPAAQPPSASAPDAQRIDDIERRLNDVTATLNQTQQALQQSLIEIQKLHAELDALQPKTETSPAPAPGITTTAATPAPATATADDLKSLHDQQDTLQAEVKQHDQTKVETTSKYPVRITGLILFNAFANAGVVDDADVPSFALPRVPGASHGSLGATVRQSVLGIDATGPRVWQSHTSAQISADFFGGLSTNANGYSTVSGIFRLRQAEASLDWQKTTVEVGAFEPIFTPLAPTSYATVAQPALSSSGNLWAWSPQIRVEQRVPISGQHRLDLEGGFIDPGTSNYITTQLVNPVEASRRPGYEGRISYEANENPAATATPFALGIGFYSSDQFYSNTVKVHAWAVTGDWQIPLYKRLGLTGEIYRGRSLGDFGGGAYKNIITGTDTITGLSRSVGVDVVGGWSQLKFQWSPTLEANASWGLDDALASNFDNLILSTGVPLEQYARNSSVIGNIIFRPKTYLIFSPEYRRIQSWRYTGSSNIADIFTLTVGFQF